MKKLELNGEINMNCYIIENDNKCFIIDPGYEKEKIIDYVNKQQLQVEAILLTHGHFDHFSAIDCFDVPVYIYEEEFELLTNDELNGFKTLNVNNPINFNEIDIRKFPISQKFYLGDKEVNVIHTPGHTQGSVCYIYDNMLFTGDTLFCNAVGRTDFPTGNIDLMKTSVVNLINNYDDGFEVHPGHSLSSTIKNEKEQNPYYLMWKN